VMMMMMTTFAITTAHAFVLTVSHDSMFQQHRYMRRHRCRRFCSPLLLTNVTQLQRLPRRTRRLKPRVLSRSLPPAVSPADAANLSLCAQPFRINARPTDETSRHEPFAI